MNLSPNLIEKIIELIIILIKSGKTQSEAINVAASKFNLNNGVIKGIVDKCL